MLIAIDASKAASTKKTGIDHVAYRIILGLSKIDKQNQYNLYTNASLDKELLSNKNFKQKLIPFPRFWSRFRLPLALMRDKPDVFLSLTNGTPFSPNKTIILIHDLAFKFFPEAYSKYELMLQENAIKIALKNASVIVFTTNQNLKDFIHFYGKPKQQTKVISLGYNHELSNNIKTEKPKKPYFLSVGRIEKRKNTLGTVKAFELFKEEDNSDYQLILVGQNGFGHEEVDSQITKSKFNEDIIRPGYVENKKLPSLYKNATALIHPSLYEGFVFPLLEAMDIGTPVLTSDVPTIKESVDDAALFVNPKDVKSIAEGMKKISTDQNLRKSLIFNGKEVIKKYSWDKTAAEYYKLINDLK